jgi:hypothetical protein
VAVVENSACRPPSNLPFRFAWSNARVIEEGENYRMMVFPLDLEETPSAPTSKAGRAQVAVLSRRGRDGPASSRRRARGHRSRTGDIDSRRRHRGAVSRGASLDHLVLPYQAAASRTIRAGSASVTAQATHGRHRCGRYHRDGAIEMRQGLITRRDRGGPNFAFRRWWGPRTCPRSLPHACAA